MIDAQHELPVTCSDTLKLRDYLLLGLCCLVTIIAMIVLPKDWLENEVDE